MAWNAPTTISMTPAKTAQPAQPVRSGALV